MPRAQIPVLARYALFAMFLLLGACGPTTEEGADGPGSQTHTDAGTPPNTGGGKDAGTSPTPGGGKDAGTTVPPPPACTPRCTGKACGPDGCGGSCGTCASGTTCDGTGRCVCVPRCDGKTCGPDGCGGTCGTCPSNSTCSADGASCGCNAGYVPDPQFQTCLRVGGTCSGVDTYGYCSGDVWVRCDAQQGLVAIDCGPDNCKTVDAQGHGACRCGAIDANGLCTSADATASGHAVHLSCLMSLGILTADNCAASTGSPNGTCSTFVTSFGSQTMCFCDYCSFPANGRCVPLCSSLNSCRYNAPGNFYTCF